MSSYRFCRTDDIGLLVDALNRCWSPYFPGQPPITPASFKQSIRDLQVWCSSCMVAFAGTDPIAVLIGAKRPAATLIHRIAVHPDHRRQGHGRHLLTSLSSKLAILGPPRIVAEVPEALAPACALFGAGGYVEEATLTDYVLEGPVLSERGFGEAESTPVEGLVIPVTIDDLAANGLLHDVQLTAWGRSVDTLTARKAHVAGLAIASDERIESYVLYETRDPGADILALCSLVEDGGARLQQLITQLLARGLTALRFPKVHPAEVSPGLLESLSFRAADRHLLYAAEARSS